MVWDPFWRSEHDPIIDRLSGEGVRRHERVQITKLNDWNRTYRSLREGANVPELYAYSNPVAISPALRARIYEQDFYSFVFFSGVCKGMYVGILGVFPQGMKVPADYTYIRVTSAKKKIFIDTTKNTYDAIVVESYDLLDPLEAYRGISYEKNLLRKIFGSAFDSGPIADSLQAPLLGSPQVVGGKGGIGLGAALDNSGFIKGLREVMQEMLPPEIRRDTDSMKPKLMETPWLGVSTQMPLHPPMSAHAVRLLSSSSLVALNQEEALRFSPGHERSYAATAFAGGSKTEVYKNLVDNFFRCDIAAVDLGQKYVDEIAFYRLRKEINDDVPACIANAHLIRPAVRILPNEEEKMFELLKKDMEVHLDGIGYRKGSQSLPRIHAASALKNGMRIAQSLARGRGDATATYEDLRQARTIINTHFERLAHHQNGEIKYHLKTYEQNERWVEVRSVVQNGRATTKEIWEEIKKYNSFDSIEVLQGYLDSLERAGRVLMIRGQYLLSN